MTIADRIVVMNNGRIEQVGTPAAIYDEPRTRFVADFIGAANLIAGRLEAGRFRSHRGLDVPLPRGPAPEGGGEIVLSIRPEKVDLGRGGAPGAIQGAVTRATKLGGLVEYLLALPSGDSLLVQTQDRSEADRYAPGDAVDVSWRPEDARLLP